MKNESTVAAAEKTSLAEVALIALALLWGTSHVITKNVLSVHTPFFYTATRFGLAAICFGLLFANHLRGSQAKERRQGALLGLCSFVGIVLYTMGMAYTTASKAGFITGLYLVFTPLLAYLLFGARPSGGHLLGLLIAIGGFGLLTYPRAGAAFNFGDGLIFCAALAWATHIAATSAFVRQSDARTLAAVQVIVVALLALFAHLLLRYVAPTIAGLPTWLAQLETRPNTLTTSSFGQILYMALLVTVVAALLQTWAQGKVATTQAALFYALEPVTAALFAWLILRETWSGIGVLGACLIVLGVLFSRLGSKALPTALKVSAKIGDRTAPSN